MILGHSLILSHDFSLRTGFGFLYITANRDYGLGMIIGNTFVILVYRYFTYKICRYMRQIIFQMPIEYVLKNLYTKITKVLPRIMPIDIYSVFYFISYQML